ncbi:hypothetical protein [uncultured Roseobacter sp.]|uniref:hypothetical protein n=1 Tax=uncultured Roseobacter sp. TaxID=114847 RepID=UPI0026359A8E|nr:hypothetical protein [uncultured Roseobacter sp.]
MVSAQEALELNGDRQKLRGCDLVKMKVVDIMASSQIKERTSVLQSKTQKPLRFEISEGTRASIQKWVEDELMVGSEYLWPGRLHERLHISTHQWVVSKTLICLNASRRSLPCPIRTSTSRSFETIFSGFGCLLTIL